MEKNHKQTIAKRKRPATKRSTTSGKFMTVGDASLYRDRVTAVLARAAESGLTLGKGGRIAGRVSPELIERAKARTGLQSDTALVEFALANVALDDNFAQVFRELRNSVDAELKLGF